MTGFLQTQSGAIAVYRTSENRMYPDSSPANSDGLIDALVYSNDMSSMQGVSRILTPDSDPVSSHIYSFLCPSHPRGGGGGMELTFSQDQRKFTLKMQS